MKKAHYNLRGVLGLLMLAVVVAAVAPAAAWQCLDGTLCSQNPSMQAAMAASPHPSGNLPCSPHCLQGKRTMHRQMTRPECVLRESPTPIAALPKLHAVPPDFASLPPAEIGFVQSAEAPVSIVALAPCAHSPPCLERHRGRAPPILL